MIGLEPGAGARPLPGPALGRRAPARGRRARHGRRAARHAHGRAVRRGRSDRARAACRTSSCACTARSARPSCSSPTTSTRRSRWATAWPSCSRVVDWRSTRRRPSCSCSRPTSSSARFVGADRGLKRLTLLKVSDVALERRCRRARRRARSRAVLASAPPTISATCCCSTPSDRPLGWVNVDQLPRRTRPSGHADRSRRRLS